MLMLWYWFCFEVICWHAVTLFNFDLQKLQYFYSQQCNESIKPWNLCLQSALTELCILHTVKTLNNCIYSTPCHSLSHPYTYGLVARRETHPSVTCGRHSTHLKVDKDRLHFLLTQDLLQWAHVILREKEKILSWVNLSQKLYKGPFFYFGTVAELLAGVEKHLRRTTQVKDNCRKSIWF